MEVLGNIVKIDGTYNITDEKGNVMLIKGYPTLKGLLQALAANM